MVDADKLEIDKIEYMMNTEGYMEWTLLVRYIKEWLMMMMIMIMRMRMIV